jgi:hypothetical protein
MSPLRITLSADGGSDKMLVSVIEWITATYEAIAFNRTAFIGSTSALINRIEQALEKEPCDILIIHRDAENENFDIRENEIAVAADSLNLSTAHVCLIPVKMTEAWFLHSEVAIRLAVGNPNSATPLNLPSIKNTQTCDAKETLRQALIAAGELSGRRLRKFNFHECRHSVARYIDDFSALRALPSFALFEQSLRTAIDKWLSENSSSA